MSKTQKIVLVTGANRGLGLETCRQLAQQGLQVILSSRDAAKGEAAVAQLNSEGLTVDYQQLDVSDAASVANLAAYIEATYGRLDVLINNAGVFPDNIQTSALDIDIDTVRQAMEINLYGALRLCQSSPTSRHKSPPKPTAAKLARFLIKTHTPARTGCTPPSRHIPTARFCGVPSRVARGVGNNGCGALARFFRRATSGVTGLRRHRQ